MEAVSLHEVDTIQSQSRDLRLLLCQTRSLTLESFQEEGSFFGFVLFELSKEV